ncbi:hypothetical protein BDF20DRAFT_838132 [Mycotypha africana]|uniref:uncharacterized protein n=1 Tax=Mycotypha africana TaxID=64632 RepID=UPI002301A244|nr:uncharacterized protein BDF20DRAFT_838132 [Mycotypha africana]KAI8971852.1 hypothetical protein BDF20DRAFT_838132 [Mycotypha africana]
MEVGSSSNQKREGKSNATISTCTLYSLCLIIDENNTRIKSFSESVQYGSGDRKWLGSCKDRKDCRCMRFSLRLNIIVIFGCIRAITVKAESFTSSRKREVIIVQIELLQTWWDLDKDTDFSLAQTCQNSSKNLNSWKSSLIYSALSLLYAEIREECVHRKTMPVFQKQSLQNLCVFGEALYCKEINVPVFSSHWLSIFLGSISHIIWNIYQPLQQP